MVQENSMVQEKYQAPVFDYSMGIPLQGRVFWPPHTIFGSQPAVLLCAAFLLCSLSEQSSLQQLFLSCPWQLRAKSVALLVLRAVWNLPSGAAEVLRFFMKECLQSWWDHMELQLPLCPLCLRLSSMHSVSSCSLKNLFEFFGVCITCLSFICVKSFLENWKG